MKITLYGIPRTKKNGQRFITLKDGRRFLIQNKNYLQWEKDCLVQILKPMKKKFDIPINIKAVIYKPDLRKSDLVGYLQAISDLFTKAEVIADDNYTIVAGYDGSRIEIDKNNPRCEIEITNL